MSHGRSGLVAVIWSLHQRSLAFRPQPDGSMMMIGWHIDTKSKGQDRILTLMLPGCLSYQASSYVSSSAGKRRFCRKLLSSCPCAAMRSLRSRFMSLSLSLLSLSPSLSLSLSLSLSSYRHTHTHTHTHTPFRSLFCHASFPSFFHIGLSMPRTISEGLMTTTPTMYHDNQN